MTFASESFLKLYLEHFSVYKQMSIIHSHVTDVYQTNFLLNTARYASLCRLKNKVVAVSPTLPEFKQWELLPIELSETKIPAHDNREGINNTVNKRRYGWTNLKKIKADCNVVFETCYHELLCLRDVSIGHEGVILSFASSSFA